MLLEDDIEDIFSNRHSRTKTILTWKGFRTIKLLDKQAVLRDMWRAFSKEIREQRLFLEDEVSKMRRMIEAEKAESEHSLRILAPTYFVEEFRILVQQLEEELGDQLAQLPEGKSCAVDKMRAMLGRAYEDQLEGLDQLEQRSQEEIDNLRRRLLRTAKDLQLSEEELGRLRTALVEAGGDGAASIYKSVQGLTSEATGFKKKSDLLKSLFEYNMEIRKDATDTEK